MKVSLYLVLVSIQILKMHSIEIQKIKCEIIFDFVKINCKNFPLHYYLQNIAIKSLTVFIKMYICLCKIAFVNSSLSKTLGILSYIWYVSIVFLVLGWYNISLLSYYRVCFMIFFNSLYNNYTCINWWRIQVFRELNYYRTIKKTQDLATWSLKYN